MTLAFDVGGCSVLVEPSDQGRKPQLVTAHNRHYERPLYIEMVVLGKGAGVPLRVPSA